ncbi:YqfQ family protein [Heyndrickxia ginsengihumi]|uniref:YqfQ family protein n=1 Tax=Heyndrickxia ginsengihumi TaxID=363870 RepID=UPI001D35C2EF|nr:hypothetical protein [Bacillus sp. (in: firmicutes)]MCM3021750.1 YqfQ family protein [Heyndrickxia ginsengihumi]
MPPRNMSPFFGPMNPSRMQPMNGMQRNPFINMQQSSPFAPRMQLGARAANTGQGGGGILSRLFNRGSTNTAVNAANAFQRTAAGGGSLTRNLLNPTSISSFLNNTQNVLRTAQQVGPMIQQYGPIVKNLPAMWKLYRGLKNSSTDVENDSNESDESTESNEKESSKDIVSKNGLSSESSSNQKVSAKATSTSSSTSTNRKSKARQNVKSIKETKTGESVPKLFI